MSDDIDTSTVLHALLDDYADRLSKAGRKSIANEYQLLGLLQQHEKDLVWLCTFDQWWYPKWFHKAFRQVDVIRGDKGQTDILIWKLLADVHIFWESYESVVLSAWEAWRKAHELS